MITNYDNSKNNNIIHHLEDSSEIVENENKFQVKKIPKFKI